jgi:cell division protein FtsI (penicillin-binding protein 3)
MMSSRRSIYSRRRRAPPGLVAAINELGEPGLALEREPDRLYPQTTLAAHVIGYTDIDGRGNAGMERAFDERLRDPELRGEPLTLSISGRIQQALEHELGDAMS